MKYFIKTALLFRDSRHFRDNVLKYYGDSSRESETMKKAINAVMKKVERAGRSADAASELPGTAPRFKKILASTKIAEQEYYNNIKSGMSKEVARQFYTNSKWFKDVKYAKLQAKLRETRDWKNYANQNQGYLTQI